MEISILSETDSRILIYPLLKCLTAYGSIVIFTTNKYLSRLIDGKLEGEFRNIRILVSPDGDLEAVKREDGFKKANYDFVIYDNIGAIDYDLLFVMITGRLSDNFVQDITYIVSDEKTKVLRFGKPGAKPKPEKKSKNSKKSKDEPEVDNTAGVDPYSFDKWSTDKTDEEVLTDTLQKEKAVWLKFPSFEMIEETESKRILPVPDQQFTKIVYSLIGDTIGVDEHNFMKGVKIKDEYSSDVSGTDVW